MNIPSRSPEKPMASGTKRCDPLPVLVNVWNTRNTRLSGSSVLYSETTHISCLLSIARRKPSSSSGKPTRSDATWAGRRHSGTPSIGTRFGQHPKETNESTLSGVLHQSLTTISPAARQRSCAECPIRVRHPGTISANDRLDEYSELYPRKHRTAGSNPLCKQERHLPGQYHFCFFSRNRFGSPFLDSNYNAVIICIVFNFGRVLFNLH